MSWFVFLKDYLKSSFVSDIASNIAKMFIPLPRVIWLDIESNYLIFFFREIFRENVAHVARRACYEDFHRDLSMDLFIRVMENRVNNYFECLPIAQLMHLSPKIL